MPADVLILGPVVFTDFAVPHHMPFGGRQETIVHKMPGGSRTIDCMGPDDADRHWNGILWGAGAEDEMQLLDALRRQGAELPFSWGAEFRTAVISHFHAEVQKFQCIHYDISIILSDGGGLGIGGLIGSITSLVGADLSSALAL